MNQLGTKLAKKRKDIGMTQVDFADELGVTRQTVSRWEAGTVMPDIDKIGDIARILGVTCDYLLRDDVEAEQSGTVMSGVGRIIASLQGKKVKLEMYEEEVDLDLINQICTIEEFEGNWMRITAHSKKGNIEKILPISSVSSIEVVKEES